MLTFTLFHPFILFTPKFAMSDILKVQTSPQFNWYNKWTHLDADGMPDKTIEEGLKQPDRIKVSFTVHKKDCTGLVVPN